MLSIITVSFNDLVGIRRTIDSVKAQVSLGSEDVSYEHILVVSGVSGDEAKALQAAYSDERVSYVFNKDRSLYHAMNIGIDRAAGTHVYFLNGGDTFFSEKSLQTICKQLRPGVISAFRVVQMINSRGYLRPGRLKDPKWVRYSHQGFVAPVSERTPRYDEIKAVSADTLWKKDCIANFDLSECDDIVCAFFLGGISNFPSGKSVALRFRSEGLKRGCTEAVKWVLCSALGQNIYFSLLARRAGYESIVVKAPEITPYQ